MVSDIAKKLNELQTPEVIEVKDFDAILAKNIEVLKQFMPDWKPLESDRYMKILRVVSYKELHSSIDRNEVIKQLLITTATGNNLDHLGARFDVFRLKGAKPTALYEFKTSKILTTPIVIPAALELTDESGIYKSVLLEDVVIPVGADSITGEVELDLFVESSKLQTSVITTPLPYLIDAKAKEDFENGAIAESDDRYRVRIIRSLGKYSTAGSRDSYLYHIYTADSRIDDVLVFGIKGTLKVEIYIHSKNGVDGIMLDRVENLLANDKVRPLNDDVSVYVAKDKKTNITATIELFDLSTAPEIRTKIEADLKNYLFSIGEHLTRSDVIRRLHIAGVYKVNSTFFDVLADKREIVKIENINLTFKEAVL